jgi:uncharacterized protein (DUF58 family)
MILPLLWVLLAALALVLSWTTGGLGFAWAGYLMLAVLLIGAAAARLGQRGLGAARRLSADRVSFGERVQVEVTVENRSSLPALWVAAAEALPAGLPMHGVRGEVGLLPGKGQFRFHYTLEGARRGYYQVGPTLLRTGDLLGLSQRERIGAASDWVTVYPRIVPIYHARLPSLRPAGDIRVRPPVLEDPTQVIGIRPYQHGDGLRRVHWRATAHTNRLQSKLYEVSAQVETTIVLDLRRAGYSDNPEQASEASELAVVAAASIAHHALDRRQRTGLLALGRDPALGTEQSLLRVSPGLGRQQLASLLSALGRVQLGAGDGLSQVLLREKGSLPLRSLVVVITPRLDRPALGALLDLRTSGFGVYAVLVGRTPPLAVGRAGLQAMGITASHVRSEADIRALGV